MSMEELHERVISPRRDCRERIIVNPPSAGNDEGDDKGENCDPLVSSGGEEKNTDDGVDT
jgi:hypothetical protein